MKFIIFIFFVTLTFLTLMIVGDKNRVYLVNPDPKKKVSRLYVDDKGVKYRYHQVPENSF